MDTSVTHDGITATVRGIGAAREETAVEIEVAVGDGACCTGIGGYQGHRRGPTALSLRDESGRVYAERWQEPGRLDNATRALFEPVHPEARELELTIPYVFVEEPDTMQAVPLPGRILIDGESWGFGYRLPGMGIATRPEPVDRLELTGARVLTAKTLGFTHPSIQVRGPWRIRFSLTDSGA